MTTSEMTQMKYIRYSDLRAYLAVLLAESRQRAAAARQTPVRCAEDAEDLLAALNAADAEELCLPEIGQWAAGNAIEGDLVLNPRVNLPGDFYRQQ